MDILTFHSWQLDLYNNLLRCLSDITTRLPLTYFRQFSPTPGLVDHLLEKAPYFLLDLKKRLGWLWGTLCHAISPLHGKSGISIYRTSARPPASHRDPSATTGAKAHTPWET
jgi:hypothetical protein